MILWNDIETRSPFDLKSQGLYKYSEGAEIILNAWAVDEGPIHVEEHISDEFLYYAQRCDKAIAHNDEFERTIWSKFYPWMGLDFPWYCTMRQARRHGLPGALDKLCDVLKIDANKAKHKDGRRLIQIFCVPNKETGVYGDKHSHPEDWAKFKAYAGHDIIAMKEVHRIVPTWNDEIEKEITHLDAVINARGMVVDVPFAKQVVATLATDAAKLADKTYAATAGQVAKATQVSKLLKYLLDEHGVDLPDMTSATIERRMNDEALPEEVRELLRLRQLSSKTSTGKYAALLRGVSSDGRLRGTMAYCGAMRTGRWAGQRFQPHNLPRLPAGVEPEDVQFEIECMQSGMWDLLCERGYSDMAATAVRGCVVASEGRTLKVGDYANIEGRIVAWLAGEQWKLDAFREYDAGTGPDLYKLAYARAFGIRPEDVLKHMRQIGKVMELMLGFGGGVGAFITGAATYGIDLDDMARHALPEVPMRVRMDAEAFWRETQPVWDEKKQEWKKGKFSDYGLAKDTFVACDSLKRLWREAHPKIAAFWYDLENAVKEILRDRGGGRAVGKLWVDMKGTWLRIGLPSGRYLCYPAAQLSNGSITYMGQHQYTRQWTRLSTYGGKVVENATQAAARDVLVHGLLTAAAEDYDVVLHVHDEGVADDVKPLDGFLKCLGKLPPWAEGLPLAVAGAEMTRYRKE